MLIKRLTPTARLPERAYSDDAGLDLFADLTMDIAVVPPKQSVFIPTGIAIALPQQQICLDGINFIYEAQVRSRSGLAAHQGLIVLNSPGTIDRSYTGEISAILYNSSDLVATIKHHQRIAQLVVALVAIPQITEVNRLPSLGSRGVSGFGSTGA